ncbi:hypothetical protein QCN29_30250 [Streptomyces sp. HNM0663]|uniref:Uncharacterized protein n=1 Tax=Streptomyces chengmaiensis TaxID=3040919 RepID=A0ABT6HWA0_9ACTN|nr:hypothetical protein [Streptomyces chengmaiensis]MDH2392984.1 hypothetical protein [Streptomyces chengmaiensis]
MATTTAPQTDDKDDDTTQELTGIRARVAELQRSPGLYAGAALGLAPTLMTDGQLLVTTFGATGVAAGWAALGMLPGPWRWLPGNGEPWEWMCRSSRRGYRRTLRRMRARLAQGHSLPPTLGADGRLVDTLGVADGWYAHPKRPALVREVTADARRARCELLRTAWARLLPDWQTGWWRRYSPVEMALRAGPLAAIPATGFVDMPWWAHLVVGSIAASWGARVWAKPDPANPETEQEAAGEDWYLARWVEWIACDRGPLPASKLASVHLDDDKLTAVIVSTTARPATSLAQDSVSIAFDVPPRAVNIYRPDDMPASRAKLTVRLRAKVTELDEDDLPAVWKGFSPYPGSQLYDVEDTPFGRKFKILLPRRGAGVSEVQPRSIAQALDMEGEDSAARLHLRVLDARRIEVNDMSINPLAGGIPLDLNALRMDDQGYVTVGRDLYGAPAKWRLLKFDPKRRGLSGGASASAVHSFGSGTTGAGKTSLEEDLQIAQRMNGFVSWLADGKGGAGYAPWMNDLDWIVKSFYGAMLMGQAANAVSESRYAEQMTMQWLDAEGYTENGRSFFVPFEPFAPVVITWDEFNEMILKDPTADHVKPLLRSVSSVGRLSRAAGMAARVWVQIPNLDSIGSDASANAIRDMLQSGNIALFRTARSDVDVMSLGSRTPEFRLSPLPERFPDGSETGGLFYIADGKAQYTQSRAMFHTNPARVSRQFPLPTLTDREAEVAGAAYLRREEYRHLDAADEEQFLREVFKEEQAKPNRRPTVIDIRPQVGPADADVDDEDLDELVPPTRSQLVWDAVDSGARRNKQIAEVTELKPTNVAGATKRLERHGKLHKIERDWHTAERLDA